MDFKLITPSQTNGQGNFSFPLVNIRCDYGFRYVQGEQAPYIVMAESNDVNFFNSNMPSQGHIALTGDSMQMRVMW